MNTNKKKNVYTKLDSKQVLDPRCGICNFHYQGISSFSSCVLCVCRFHFLKDCFFSYYFFNRGVKRLVYSSVVLILATISAVISGCGKDPAYRQDFRTSIPLTILYSPLNNSSLVTPEITIKVNGVDCQVLFDTGSQGLRLIHGALGSTAVDTDREIVTYGYGYPPGVLEIRGKIAGALIKVGDLPAYTPIRFMRIDDTAGSIKGPWVSINNVPRLNDKHFRGLSGIFGTGFRATKSGISNPLAQLPGNGSYIVHFPDYGGRQGNVLVNPAGQDLDGFIMYRLDADSLLLPNGMRSWKDASLLGRISYDGTANSLLTLLDTGSPITEAYGESLPFYGRIMPGHQVILAISANSGETETLESFVVQNQQTGVDRVAYNHSGSTAAHMSFGTNLFFKYDVLFDQRNGVIGLRKKTI